MKKEREREKVIKRRERRVLARRGPPDVLLPKNCFSANQIAAFKWADRLHVPNGCLHLFIANVSKTRERSGAYCSAPRRERVVSRLGGGEARDHPAGNPRPQRGNKTKKTKERFYSRESSAGPDGRADTMHFDFYAEINVL